MKGSTSKIRFDEATKLLDYGFSKFEYIKYSNKGDIAQQVYVEKGISESVNAIFAEDAGALIPKGQSSDIVTNISLPNTLQAPVEEGQVIGTVTYSIGDEILGTVNLIASKSVPKLTLFNMMSSVLDKWISLLK